MPPDFDSGKPVLRVPLQFGQVVERVGVAQLAGVNQTHEQVAHLRPVQRPIKQGVLPMQNRPLQRSFTKVVVQRGAGLPQKQCQRLPVPEQIRERLPQTRIGLHLPLGKLCLQPVVQRVQDRLTVLLMKAQPFLRRQVGITGLRIIPVDLAQLFQHVPALDGKVLRHFYNLAPSVGETMGHQAIEAHSRACPGLGVRRLRCHHFFERRHCFGRLVQLKRRHAKRYKCGSITRIALQYALKLRNSFGLAPGHVIRKSEIEP